MATIHFFSPTGKKTVTVDVKPGERRTLLDVAQSNGVPVLFNCKTGDCSACVVHVETEKPPSMPLPPVTHKEEALLLSMCLLGANDIEAAKRKRVSAGVRLACQYMITDETISVDFQSTLGGS